jgi:hypothetical protein
MTYDEISILRDAQTIIYKSKSKEKIYDIAMDAIDLIIKEQKTKNDLKDFYSKMDDPVGQGENND